MKLVIIATALLLGGTAVAQTEDPGTMTPTGATASPPCTGPKVVKAGNIDRKRDARGIPVTSDDGLAPNCFNEQPWQVPAGTQPSSPTAEVSPSGPLPACDKTRTDRCRQTYDPR